ncbi:MAG: phospho-N-acetylmuramoyl-pentapeptide-transferase [Candidatus Bipolaricaulota bacterium]
MEGLRLALILALAVMPIAAWGSPVFARRIRAGQRIRPEGPAGHLGKAGTPTMGGAVPLALILLGVGILWALGPGPSWGGGFVLAATAAGGVVGLLDDLRSQRKAAGFFPHQTLLVQVALGALLCALVPAMRGLEFAVPFSSLKLSLAAIPVWAWAPLVIAGFVGTVNGVNLADGLDGLATGAWLLALLGLLPAAWGKPELRGIALLGAGAGGGFLWANTYPARVFLGNVGSMGLGGFLFGIAFASGALFLLPLLGGVFVLTTLSVILQVGSYKLTGVRLFKMSPLHHHLEAGAVPWPHRIPGPNWPEPKVVVRLWLLGAAFALLGILACWA